MTPRWFVPLLFLSVACRAGTESPSSPPPRPLTAPVPSPRPLVRPEDVAALPRTVAVVPPSLPADELARWSEEIRRVEEAREAGSLSVPAELQHYEDTRRFLAIQIADARARRLHLPTDLADLARLVRGGELVELPPLGEHYVLYDVGTDAEEDPWVHFDPGTGDRVRLLPSAEAWQQEKTRLAAEAATDARARTELERHARVYDDPARAARLFEAHATVAGLAADWNGDRFDLASPADRLRFQVRLLSSVRPEARDAILALAAAYHARFGRLLPVSSLVRTRGYQQRLTQVNANATEVDAPPHTTGNAFDVSYRFLSNEEQSFVMEQVARMEREGRVESLRERRACVHVYALPAGRPPEHLIAEAFGVVDAAREAD